MRQSDVLLQPAQKHQDRNTQPFEKSLGKSTWSIELIYFSSLFSVSYPRGDTELLVGSEAIDIFCHLNPNYKPYWGKGLRSSHLSFHLRPKDGSEWAELESLIVNETTIAAKYNPDRVAKGKKLYTYKPIY